MRGRLEQRCSPEAPVGSGELCRRAPPGCRGAGDPPRPDPQGSGWVRGKEPTAGGAARVPGGVEMPKCGCGTACSS